MAQQSAARPRDALPNRPIERLTRPFVHYMHVESSGGIALMACTALALILANSPLASQYQAFWNQELTIGVEGFRLSYPVWYWINDGLMTIFFFVIGLEIKRELAWGELSDRRQVVFPVGAAIGGAVVPVAIYLALQHEGEAMSGWAVPMATDIAFVVGILALLGDRIPRGLKVLMLALAIVDDILAVLVIAVFYAGSIKLAWLGGAAGGFLLIFGLNRAGVRTVPGYMLVGAIIWLCTLKSGVHPTVAGVLLGLLTPHSAWIGQTTFADVAGRALHRLGTHGSEPAPAQHERRGALADVRLAAREAVPPLERLEHDLHPWVAFGIMPLFALANAGVPIELGTLGHPVALAVAAGLVVGKPIGVALAGWIATAAGWAELPRGVSWPLLLGGGCLAGIGFTMSLFIASLGLEGELLAAAKAGILLASVVAAALGSGIILLSTRRAPATG